MAAVLVGMGVWSSVVPLVAAGLRAEAGFGVADAWVAASSLSALGALTAHRHRAMARHASVAGSVAQILVTGVVGVVLFHLAFHGDQGPEFVYGWAPAFGEVSCLLVLGTAVPFAVAEIIEKGFAGAGRVDG
ncbi:hypothetical protein ACFRMQ_11130 [Kitasatospora sp. NPDC056783]|uniref:hypothetical protein n=1 Tax=Kitasatospora sp. NPDC056783 TaxID=3345943 RepID=UPI0036AA4BF6